MPFIKGNKGFWLGKKFSDEHRGKISLSSKGKHFTEEHRRHLQESAPKGENHYLWKGDLVGYSTLHRWVQKHKGRAFKCEKCGSTSKMEWANTNRQYKRNLTDWIQLCHSCHMKYDGIPNKVWETRRLRYGKNGHKVTASWKGWKQTSEARAKMSERRKGKRFTDEHKENLSKSLKRTWMQRSARFA